jgi:hypothetical protein
MQLYWLRFSFWFSLGLLQPIADTKLSFSAASSALRSTIFDRGVMGLRPTKVMKNASVQQPLSLERLPFPLSSRAADLPAAS